MTEASTGPRITRRTLLKSGAGVGLGLAFGLSCSDDPWGTSGPRPHVVVITLDSLRAISLPMYGCPRNTAPFLGELAERSSVYRSCYASAPTTRTAVAGLLTGLLPHQLDVARADSPLPADVPTFAAAARGAGYQTAFFSGNPALVDGFGLQAHFDRVAPAGASMVGAFSEWLDRSTGAPVCAYLQVDQPRGPFGTPDAYLDQAFGQGRVSPLDPAYLEPHDRDVDIALASYGVLGRFPFTESRVDASRDPLRHVLRYEARILHADAIVRSLFDAFRDLRPDERAVFIITGDHGEAFGEQAQFGDSGQLLQETCLRVPLIIHDTAHPRAVDAALPVSHLELPTAIARWTRSEQSLGFYSSALPFAGSPPRDPARAVLSQQFSDTASLLGRGEGAWALTRGPWRLVYNDAPDYGHASTLQTVTGAPVDLDRPRVATPIQRSALPHAVDLAPGVRLMALGFANAHVDPRVAQELAARVRVAVGAEGVLHLRAVRSGRPPVELGRFPCDAGVVDLRTELAPIGESGDGPAVDYTVEAAWASGAGAAAQAEDAKRFRPLYSLPTFAKHTLTDAVSAVGFRASPPVLRAGGSARIGLTCLLTAPGKAPRIPWRVLDADGRVLGHGVATQLADAVAALFGPEPALAEQLLHVGLRFDEQLDVTLPADAKVGVLRVEAGGEDGAPGTLVGRLEVAPDVGRSLERGLDLQADATALDALAVAHRAANEKAPDLDAPLMRAAARFDAEGEIPYLLARRTDDPQRRRAHLDACLKRTPFHRAGLLLAADDAGSSARAADLAALTPSRPCQFDYADALRLFGFDLRRVRPDGAELDLDLYWEARSPALPILAAELWLNYQQPEDTRVGAWLSWLIGGDRRPSDRLAIGEAIREKIRLPLPARQTDFDLTLLVYPHWDYVYRGRRQKDFLPARQAEGAATQGAHLGHFVIADQPVASQDSRAARRRDPLQYRLHDVVADPLERTNLADREPDRFAELQAELLALLEASDVGPG